MTIPWSEGKKTARAETLFVIVPGTSLLVTPTIHTLYNAPETYFERSERKQMKEFHRDFMRESRSNNIQLSSLFPCIIPALYQRKRDSLAH